MFRSYYRARLIQNRLASGQRESGQTLIETLVAIFVLVTGLISAVSLAVASFNSTDNTNKQITATALAREAIEGVRNIRDQNWLNDTLVTCSDLGSSQKCYQNWEGLDGATALRAGTYSVDYNTSNSKWTLSPSSSSYVLNYNSSSGLYSNQAGGAPSLFSRKVTIVETVVAPYTAQNPRLDISSTVWWQGRSCPSTTDPSTVPFGCKVVLQMYLTNWRAY